jgi:hypothetical protein
MASTTLTPPTPATAADRECGLAKATETAGANLGPARTTTCEFAAGDPIWIVVLTAVPSSAAAQPAFGPIAGRTVSPRRMARKSSRNARAI